MGNPLRGLLLCSFLAPGVASAILEPATPESQGVSSQGVLDWIDACENTFDRAGKGTIRGFVIVRHGKTVAEGSWRPFDTLNEPHMLYSHSKSFTSTAVGFLVDDGKLDLDERVVDIFPEAVPANACENLRMIRVRDLLTMTHGEETSHTIYKEAHWVNAFMRKAFTHGPGLRMWYDSDATYMLAAIVARRSGMDMWDFLKARLLDKIGIEKAWTTRSPQGIPCGGWGMNMTTRELARFGQFYLQRGAWNGEQLLSPDWVSLATTRQTWCDGIRIQSQVIGSGSDWRQGYGFQFWRCRHGAYRADGAAGQLTVVFPEQDAVVSVHAAIGDMQAELNLIWDHLLPAFRPAPLPEDAALAARLRDRLANLAIPPLEGTRQGAADGRLGQTFEFPENRHGVRSVRFDRTGDGWSCSLVTPCGEQSFPVGHGRWAVGEIALGTGGPERLFSYPGSYKTVASGAFGTNGNFRVRMMMTRAPTGLLFDLPPEGPLGCRGFVDAELK